MTTSSISIILIVAVLSVALSTTAFAPLTNPSRCRSHTQLYQEEEKDGGPSGFFSNFFEELDAFVDDATNRRMGNGAAFYGKRKSEFYGKEDVRKKKNKNKPDPLEDYQGPKKSGYFQWKKDEDGMLRPVTRGKKQTNIERNPSFWDKAFKDK